MGAVHEMKAPLLSPDQFRMFMHELGGGFDDDLDLSAIADSLGVKEAVVNMVIDMLFAIGAIEGRPGDTSNVWLTMSDEEYAAERRVQMAEALSTWQRERKDKEPCLK